MSKTFFLFLIWILYVSIINAQSLSIDSASIPEYEETTLTKSIFPVVFYLPETRLGFGLTGIIAKDNYNDTTSNLSRISQIQPSIAYTINNQLLIYLPYELYFDKDNWKIKGELGYYKYFYSYYGIGTSALLEDKENYDVDYPRFEARITRRIRPTFSAGLIYRYDDYDIKRLESEGLLESRNTRGINGGTLSAFGALIEYDNRDDIFLPYKGGIGTATYLNSHDRFGSPYNFTKVDLGYSYYFSIKPEHILALDLRTGWINGDAPFYEYFYIGSPKLARGVLDRRYIDRSYFAIQQEFRFPVWRRFAATLFHSIGTVESKWSNLFKKDARYIYAYGLGLRYKLTKAERVRLRMDFGFSESQFNFYFTIGEAF